jgi:hypothetical protein
VSLEHANFVKAHKRLDSQNVVSEQMALTVKLYNRHSPLPLSCRSQQSSRVHSRCRRIHLSRLALLPTSPTFTGQFPHSSHTFSSTSIHSQGNDRNVESPSASADMTHSTNLLGQSFSKKPDHQRELSTPLSNADPTCTPPITAGRQRTLILCFDGTGKHDSTFLFWSVLTAL